MSEGTVDQLSGINEEVQLLKKGQLISREAASPIIGEQLQAGRIVLLGDTHDSRDQHEYFANIIGAIAQQGTQFVVALELPTQLDESVNRDIPEEIVKALGCITGLQHKTIGQGANYLSADLPLIIEACRKHNIPIVCIDDCKVDLLPSEKNHFNNMPGVKTRDDWMVRRLKEGQIEHSGLGVLVMVGAWHLKPENIPLKLSCITIKMSSDENESKRLGIKPTAVDKDLDYVIDFETPKPTSV